MFGLLLCRSCRSMKRSRSEWRRYVSKSLDPKTRNTFAQVTLEWPKLYEYLQMRHRCVSVALHRQDNEKAANQEWRFANMVYPEFSPTASLRAASNETHRRAINDYLADPSSNPKSKPSSFGKQPRSTHSKISACNNFAESETQDSEGCFPS